MRKIGLSTRLALTFLSFSALVIALLWILQVVFLNDVYRAIKTNSVRSSAAGMQGMSDREMASFAQDIAASYGICTSVFDPNMNELVHEHVNGQCLVHSLNPLSDLALYRVTEKQSDASLESYLPAEQIAEILNQLDLSMNFYHFFGQPGQNRPGTEIQPDSNDCILRCQILTNDRGETRFLMLSSIVIPVDATVETIRFEMLIISAVLLVVSLALSFVLSRRIAGPLVRLNQASAELPRGKFDPSGIRGDREIMELTETLSDAASEINKVETLRRELIANVSHDLRTPLTLITGYSEVMRDLPGENTPENLQIVIDEAQRLSSLVTDLLDLSKMEAGMDALRREKLEFVSFLREIMHRYKKLTENDGYVIRFDSALSECFILADPVKLNQAVYNLVNNAINYCGEDRTVQVVLSKGEGFARLDVIDHGEGIPREKLADIWDRYYRVDKNHRQPTVGTGLGLSIVKEVLLQHQARFGVESDPGQGSDFWFEIPLYSEN